MTREKIFLSDAEKTNLQKLSPNNIDLLLIKRYHDVMDLELIKHFSSKAFAIARNTAIIIAIFVFVIIVWMRLVGIDRGRQVGMTAQVSKQMSDSRESTRQQIHKQIFEDRDTMSPAQRASAETVASTSCFFLGELCSEDFAKSRKDGNLLSKFTALMVFPIANPPASGIYWVSNSLENAGFVPKTYAQGIGFSALSSYQVIWKAMRDLVYLVIVLVIVGVGFMVMFNAPMGSKTSVTLEAMLPRLVVTLLLISFSYAIAGFLVDMMYLALFFVYSFFAPLMTNWSEATKIDVISSLASGQPLNLINLFYNGGAEQSGLVYGTANAIYQVIPVQVQRILDAIVMETFRFSIVSIISSVPGVFAHFGAKDIAATLRNKSFANSSGNLAQKIAAFFAGSYKFGNLVHETKTPILSLIIRLVLWFALDLVAWQLASKLTVGFIMIILFLSVFLVMIRIFWMLLSTYVQVIVSVMIAPFIIMFNALPGKNSFVSWFKTLAIDLMVFPATFALFMMSAYIVSFVPGTGQMWAPPFLNSIANQGAIQFIIASVLAFNIPFYIKKMKSALHYEGNDAGPGILSVFGPAAGVVTSVGSFQKAGLKWLDRAKKDGPQAVITNEKSAEAS
jgi:hypothetical protein